MNKGITVLSLFDGMSCGQIALKELGIKVDKYYASEIDKHAIKQTMLNFPDTIQLGSVTEVDARKLGHIDLLIGGSPCTNFSFAGRRKDDPKRKAYKKEYIKENQMTDEQIIVELKNEPAADLRRLQHMPYEWKLQHAKDVIREFVEHEGLNGVYVSFSGGKDSLVLLHLVRSIFPDVPAVFANTGIEFPEQVQFVRTFDNVTEVYPVKHFPKIIKEEGIVYPSKEVSMYVKDAKKGCKYAINGFKGLDKDGNKNRYKSRFKKWAYLLECGVKISPVCCDLMKEIPMKIYENKHQRSPFIGIRAEESFRRSIGWMKSGCNSFSYGRAKSTPLALWVESDVMQYIKENGIELSPMYSAGMKRTGCMFCPVPIAHGDTKNIAYAKKNHAKLYDTIMNKHGLADMLAKVMMEVR